MHPVLQFLHAIMGTDHRSGPHSAQQTHRQLPVRKSPPQQLGNNTLQAQQYAAHPEHFAGANSVDPSQFGYPADINGSQQLHVNQPHNFGIPQEVLMGSGLLPDTIDALPANWSQGGMQSYNPGYIPLQNSGFGAGGHPQISAFTSPQGLTQRRLNVIQQAYSRLR